MTDPVRIEWDEQIQPDEVQAVGGIVFRVEHVSYWGQRVAPPPMTPIYQDGESSYNTQWRTRSDKKEGERVGIYLGNELVAIVTTGPLPS